MVLLWFCQWALGFYDFFGLLNGFVLVLLLGCRFYCFLKGFAMVDMQDHIAAYRPMNDSGSSVLLTGDCCAGWGRVDVCHVPHV